MPLSHAENHYWFNRPTYSFFHVMFALLGLQCLPHAKRGAALIQRLVSSNCHLDFIPDSKQQ